MPVTIQMAREYEFVGIDLLGDPCLFARDARNHVFVQASNFETKTIDAEPEYLAFPQAHKLGGTLVGIYSAGPDHGASNRQMMFRSDDGGVSFSIVKFFDAITGEYDLSLLTGLIPPGDAAVFKVWTIKNTAGTLTPTITSSVSHGGRIYSFWSRVVKGLDGVYYRTAYTTDTSSPDQNPAVFESTDQITWTFKSIVMISAGLKLNECSIIETASGQWLAVCREDTGDGNPLYYATSSDNMQTWSAPIKYDLSVVNGRQPDLCKLSDGSIVLATGDRSGYSGYGGLSDDQIWGADTTGITVFRTTNMSGATWGWRTKVATMWSTDGGQPSVVEVTPGRLFVAYYSRRGSKLTPIIGSSRLDTWLL